MKMTEQKITLYSEYQCDCGEVVFTKPKEEAQCDCGPNPEFTFKGLTLYESIKVTGDGDKPYFLGESWMESAGCPICFYCNTRDFDCENPNTWLVESDEILVYKAACPECQNEHELIRVDFEALDKELDGLVTQTSKIAEEHNARLLAQMENDALNYSEKYFRDEYGISTDAFYASRYKDDADMDVSE
ncbi:hypothetical protein HUB94_20435 (plasmid) [Paenibacillus cellulosilyticus]|uniref:hypothetical protein n=1 Tax=Paenibacillus cellulosilyticus TaxID=375489 RepID=UPI0011B7E06A|nr:hypothetical protein [Paenibacillus cellulosilyticus]QKS46854.1 hypothetical protein HUB94_20435 [Paenibacillus cellulosilyticus]